MPNPENPPIPETPKQERRIEQAFEFRDAASINEYLEWREEVPFEFRRIIESQIKGSPLKPSQTGLRLTDQFLDIFSDGVRSGMQPDVSATDPQIAELIEPLSRIETRSGHLNVFETMANPDVSWKLRQTIYKFQIKPILEWLVQQDLEESQKQSSDAARLDSVNRPPDSAAENKPDQNDIPSSSENVRSSMESGIEKREGPPTPLFLVKPFYGGYYRQLVFERFEHTDLKWKKAENQFVQPELESLDTLGARYLSGKIHGNTHLAIPLPYNWAVDPQSVESDASQDDVELFRNQDGLTYLRINAHGEFSYRIKIARKRFIQEVERLREARMSGELPSELITKIEDLKKQNLPRLKLKREVVKLVRSHLTYSNNPEVYRKYISKPDRYFKQIWKSKEADCFVANTLAARALGEIDTQFRFVSGYMVSEKNEQGAAIMHSGNGHAWLELWDEASRRIVRLDATPKGDPNVDQKQQEQELEGEGGEGDYGEEELMSEEEAKIKARQMERREGNKDKRQKNSSDLAEQQFSELAECTAQQAREFLQALDRVRQIKNDQGVSISDLMKQEWQKIIEERKIEQREYRGPVRMDEGNRLEDPVEAFMDIKSKEYNPTGFELDETKEKLRSDFGGLHIYFSFDLSGSMASPDAVTGRSKADVQRDAALLFVDSLTQCAFLTRQYGQESDLLPLKIMVTLASDRGQICLPLTDKWGPKEQWAMYSSLIRPASGGTPTHQTLQLIEKEFDKEALELKRKGTSPEKLPISYVVEISDGAPDDFDQTETMHQKLKAKNVVIRSYPVGDASASADAAPPLASFSEIPQILAKDIVEKFKKLRPLRIP